MNPVDIVTDILTDNAFVMSFMLIAAGMAISGAISKYIFKGKIPTSAVAVLVGLITAYIGGIVTGGDKGISDIAIFSGIGILGGSSIRDFAIISTAYGASFKELKSSGIIGAAALIVGVVYAFITGFVLALIFGYTDPVEITTVAAGAATFIAGPVTGTALGASSDIIAVSIAIGIVKSIAVMVLTPIIAKWVKLDNYRSAMVYGGIMGTTSGVSAGLAATDQRLVPYGAMVATFYTGLSCLLCPTVLYGLVMMIV